MIDILLNLNKCTVNIIGSAVISMDCTIICNSMSQDTINRYSAEISRALIAIKEKYTTRGFMKWKPVSIVIRNSSGNVLMTIINESELLIVITKSSVNIDFILLLVRCSLNYLSMIGTNKKTTVLCFKEWVYKNINTDNSTKNFIRMPC